MKGKKYLILTYLLTALIVFYFSTSSEKQVISNYNVVFGFGDFFQIFLKNLIASIWLLLSYVFGESIIYIFFVINGIVLGLLLSSFSSITYLLLILPHGLIEIGTYVYLSDIIMKNKNQDKKKAVKHLVVSFLLLALAAGVETFITPLMITFIS
ncbi:stage II sporulation protein M [Streptococcus sp. OBRC6]|uniref:stage II sporulation protein M n=1 Tax=Streptococcus sp. OBRC6 TaxID=936587 RepID=UPI0004503032|nr:stage II sporulation protein M [Streptococcus sp. OBRC6]ETS95662.1 putative membrane protein [Streptococcus sp. OBRC6]